MSSISSEDIISILKEEIENYDFDSRDKEVGKVIYVGDGIVTVYGKRKTVSGTAAEKYGTRGSILL